MSTELAHRDDAGLIDLVEARQLIEQAGQNGDTQQLKEWYVKLGKLWTNSREEANKAGEVRARIEREIGLIDLRQYHVGHTSKNRPPFPVSDMPKWLQTHCRRLAKASQEEFDRVIEELWRDQHREICTSAFRVLKIGSNRDWERQQAEIRTTRWREMREAGLTVRQIAERDAVSMPTVYHNLAPSAERKQRARQRQRRWNETQKLRREKAQREQMAARDDARGRAYVLVDQKLLALLDEANRQAGSRGERQECSTAYDLALKLREALYRAEVEKGADEWSQKAGARVVHGHSRGAA